MPFMNRPPRIIAAWVAGGLALLLLVGGCGGADSASLTTAATATTATTAATTVPLTTATTAATTASATTTTTEPASAILFPFQDDDGLWGFMDARGETVIDARFDEVHGSFESGAERVPVDLKGRVCFVDRTGAVVAEADPRVDVCFRVLKAGPMPVTFAGGQELGLMDLEGRVLVEPRYGESLQFFYAFMGLVGGCMEEGAPLPVARDEQFGFVDSTGALVIPLQYDLALWFSEGLAAAGDSDAGQALLGYIDTEGNTSIEPQFAAAGPFSEGLAAAVPQGGGKIGFIDRAGTWVIEPQFEWDSSWMLFNRFSEGLVPVVQENLIGYVDISGHWAIDPQFPASGQQPPGDDSNLTVAKCRFSNGLAPVPVGVGEGRRWGYIDRTGHFVIPVQFHGAGLFQGGLASVSVWENELPTASGYIDTTGRWVRQWVPYIPPAEPRGM